MTSLLARLACLFWGHRWAITNRVTVISRGADFCRTRAGIYAPRLVCRRCGKERR